jgi:uncharacterized protein (DUF2384 family)
LQIRAGSHRNIHQGVKHALGTPGLKQVKANAQAVFLKVAACWGLTERQRHTLLSEEPIHSKATGSTLLAFNNRLRTGEYDALLRISEVLEVFLLCRKVFQDDAAAARWLRSPSKEPHFCNLTPLTWMIHGGPMGIFQLRDFLATRPARPDHSQIPSSIRDASCADEPAQRIHSD